MDRKVALVTGAAMGIGAAIAQGLARDGRVVVVADIDAEAAVETARSLSAEGLEAWPLAMDVGDAESVEAGFEAVRMKYGRCDILVNNAGIAKTYPFLECPMAHWDRVLAVNVTGPLICSQHAARMMRERRWGRIVNMTSVSGMRASAGRTAYGTSKAALIGLTRQMAVELAAFGITANGVSPGPIDTPLTLANHSEATRASYARSIPAARYGTPEEVAAAVAYLASDRASFITGHILPVDGGFMAAGLLEI